MNRTLGTPPTATRLKELYLRCGFTVAKQCQEYIVSSLSLLGAQDEIYTTSARDKSEISLEKKLSKKGIEASRAGKQYDVFDVTDIVGIRIVSKFRSANVRILDLLIQTILRGDIVQFGRSPFSNCHITEAIAFITNPRVAGNDISTQFRECLTKRGISGIKLDDVRDSDKYSSLHLIVWVDSRNFQLNAREHFFIPIEFQVRSSFEDAWGELDHLLAYKPKLIQPSYDDAGAHALGASDDEGSMPSNQTVQQRYSNVLKQVMDAAASLADLMVEQDRLASYPDKRVDPGIAPVAFSERILVKSGLKREHIDNILLVLNRIPVRLDVSGRADHRIEPATTDDEVGPKPSDEVAAAAHDSTSETPNYVDLLEQIERFINDKVIDASANIKSNSFEVRSSEIDRMSALFVLRMEAAVCRILIGSEQSVETAIADLEMLAESYPDTPVVHFRLGEACIKWIEIALEKVKTTTGHSIIPGRVRVVRIGRQAFQLCEETLAVVKGLTESDMPATVSESHVRYLHDHLARKHAFFGWRVALLLRIKEKGPHLYGRILLWAVMSLNTKLNEQLYEQTSRTRILNNLVYFAAEYLDLEVSQEDRDQMVALLSPRANELRATAPREVSDVASLGPQDSLQYAFWQLDDHVAADEAAEMVLATSPAVFKKIMGPGEAYLKEQFPIAHERALKVQRWARTRAAQAMEDPPG